MCLALGFAPIATPAQDRLQASVLVIDQERLFAETVFGLRLSAELEAASRALATENREIEAALIAEERALTEARSGMSPEEFRAAADAFDARVTQLRSAQDRKSQELVARRDLERQRFLDRALPVLGSILQEYGAYVLVDRRQVFLSDDRVNITDEAIARIGTALGSLLEDPEAGSDPADAPQTP